MSSVFDLSRLGHQINYTPHLVSFPFYWVLLLSGFKGGLFNLSKTLRSSSIKKNCEVTFHSQNGEVILYLPRAVRSSSK